MKRILTYPQAILEALEQEMSRDRSVVVLGQGVDDPKGTLGTTKGLAEKFGPQRVFDTPLSEDAITGAAVGMAMAGLRPVNIHIRMDFLLLAMNQIVNMAAKMRYMFGGAFRLPLVIRSMIGKSWGQGPQHSQSLYPLFMNIPGLKIVAPVTPYDAKGCLVSSIRDNNPVIFIEHRLLYYQRGFVPHRQYTVPLGCARVLSKGSDITLAGVSQTSIECLRAGVLLKAKGINAEVIDLLSLSPLDMRTLEKSVQKTGKIIIVDNSWMTSAAAAEIAARLAEKGIMKDICFSRMGFAATPCPTTPSLERYFYPDAGTVASRAYALLFPRKKPWRPAVKLHREEIEFKGPF